MLRLLKYSDDFQKSQGLNQPWFKDSHTTAHFENNAGVAVRQSFVVQKPGAKGLFSFRVPLKHSFSFCDEYNKIVYGLKHQLLFVRKDNNDVIFRNGTGDAGRLLLQNVHGMYLMWKQHLKKKISCTKQFSPKWAFQ